MAAFHALIRFESTDDNKVYFADLGPASLNIPGQGTKVNGYETVEDLQGNKGGKPVSVGKILAPVPRTGVPIYCVGLNYTSHAAEAKLSVPKNPPLWTKPTAALANPGEEIKINKFCASSLLDYEGELVFVTSQECRDITPEEASAYILGYTIGNDLSCRIFQLPDQAGGQFFFAKAFDKFAPIGPVLVAPEVFARGEGLNLITRLNGEVMQNGDISNDMIWKPAKILSWMSQGTTIPAGTAVMTGTPAGVAVFKDPRRLLKNGDIVEVEIPAIGTLRNKIVFED